MKRTLAIFICLALSTCTKHSNKSIKSNILSRNTSAQDASSTQKELEVETAKKLSSSKTDSIAALKKKKQTAVILPPGIKLTSDLKRISDSVGLIALIDKTNSTIITHCSGTFISSNTMITAAHCVSDHPNVILKYFPGDVVDLGQLEAHPELLKSSGIKALHIIQPGKKYCFNLDEPAQMASADVVPFDVAILLFPDNTAPSVSELFHRSPKEEDKVTLIGFELSTSPNDKRAYKQIGLNEIPIWPHNEPTFPGTIIIAGSSSGREDRKNVRHALTTFGDSGGPLFINNAVAGVTSGGDYFLKLGLSQYAFGGDSFSIFSDLSHEVPKKFLELARSQGAKFEYKVKKTKEAPIKK